MHGVGWARDITGYTGGVASQPKRQAWGPHQPGRWPRSVPKALVEPLVRVRRGEWDGWCGRVARVLRVGQLGLAPFARFVNSAFSCSQTPRSVMSD